MPKKTTIPPSGRFAKLLAETWPTSTPAASRR